MAQHSITRGWAQAGLSYQKTQNVVADSEVNADVAVPDSSTDLEALLPVDVSQVKSIFILSDQDVTLETNDGSTPADTIALKADVPLIWELSNGYYDCPFSEDVTAMYFTNASGSAATVQIRTLQDLTP